MKNALGTVQLKRCRFWGAEEQGGLHPLFLRCQSLTPALHKHRKGWYDRVGKRSELPRESQSSHFILHNAAHAAIREVEGKLPTGGNFPLLLVCRETEA